MCSAMVSELSRVTPESRTLDEKDEWELFRERNKIKLLEMLRGSNQINRVLEALRLSRFDDIHKWRQLVRD